MILADFRVDGRPRTKGSLKPMCHRDRNHTVYMKEQVTESRPWRAKVARACREYQLSTFGALRRFEGPVEVRAVFFMPREESVNGGPWPSHDTQWPTAINVGDGDKMLRNVGDALLSPKKRSETEVTSGLLADDSQITRQSGLKIWCLQEFEQPQARILVTTAPEPGVSLAEEREAWLKLGAKL